MPSPSTPLAPLAGVRVLDVATVVAAPFATSCLAEFGADVIKIEKPGQPDVLRSLGTPAKEAKGETYWWLSDARNKRCITLNLSDSRGAAIFKKMVPKADVVAENFRPGTMERWGIGWEDLNALHAGLVMLRVSAYGQSGPKKNEPGFARIAQAYCGLTFLTGLPDSPPLSPGSNTLCDYLTGLYGAFGIMLALRSKDQTGKGQYIDLSLYEGMFRFLDELAPSYDQTGHVRMRMGGDVPHSVPHNHYATQDGKWIAIACTNDRMFARLAQAMGMPEMASKKAWGLKKARIADWHAVNNTVIRWTQSHTLESALRQLTKYEVPCGPINSIADAFADPHFQARQSFMRFPDSRFGKAGLAIPNVVARLSETPGKIKHLGRGHGEDNAQVFMDELGMRAEDFLILKKERVV